MELAPGPGAQVAKRRTFLTSYLRTSQLESLGMPNVSYASAVDKGDPFSPNGWWHPRYKQPVRCFRSLVLFVVLCRRSDVFLRRMYGCIGRRAARCCDAAHSLRPDTARCEWTISAERHADYHGWTWNCSCYSWLHFDLHRQDRSRLTSSAHSKLLLRCQLIE